MIFKCQFVILDNGHSLNTSSLLLSLVDIHLNFVLKFDVLVYISIIYRYAIIIISEYANWYVDLLNGTVMAVSMCYNLTNTEIFDSLLSELNLK